MNVQKSEIDLQVNDRTARAYLAAPEGGGPGVLVLHAWWGLKPFFKKVADRLASEGFTALAPDLYQGRTANTVEEAKALLEKREFEFMGAIVGEAVRHLCSLTSGDIGAMGFSMGAAWGLVCAANEPDLKALVLFYGSEGVEFSQIKARVLAHFAEEDEWEPLDGVRYMEKGMKAAGLDTTFHIYPGVHHWFMEDDRPEYDQSAAQTAWERTIAFLHESLKED